MSPVGAGRDCVSRRGRFSPSMRSMSGPQSRSGCDYFAGLSGQEVKSPCLEERERTQSRGLVKYFFAVYCLFGWLSTANIAQNLLYGANADARCNVFSGCSVFSRCEVCFAVRRRCPRPQGASVGRGSSWITSASTVGISGRAAWGPQGRSMSGETALGQKSTHWEERAWARR